MEDSNDATNNLTMIHIIVFKQRVKIIIMFLLFVMSNLINSQPLSNNFSIGNYLDIFNNDSIKIYYNCAGGIVDKRCADFFRIGKMDSLFCNITGNFKDYFITGEIAFKGIMRYGKLTGIGTYFYKNGKVSEIGVYSNNIRIGEWRYFYPDGRLMKTFNFIGGETLVINYYDAAGIERVKNGNGYYVGFFKGHNGCFPFIISGKIYEGKIDSIWTFSGRNNEVWDKGIFISGSTYTKDNKQYPMMRLQGFVGEENFSIVETSIGCSGNIIFLAKYKGDDLHSTFYPSLERKLKRAINYKIANQWIIVGIEIDKNDKLNQVNVHSSINDTLVENIIFDLINKSNKSWKTMIMNRMKVETDLLFTIIVENNKIQIQTYY